MSTSALQLVNGVPRMQVILPLIYDKTVSIVASGGSAPNSLNGPVSSGTAITLPGSQTYTLNSNSVPNLQIKLNGQWLEYTTDWATSGTTPFSAFTLTLTLQVGDLLELRIERNS
jgi:hypothetical protein